MFKTKLKNSLVCEYIDICQMNNYCLCFPKEEQDGYILNKISALKKKYEQIFFRIGCFDLTFCLLRSNLSQKADVANFLTKVQKNKMDSFKKLLYNYEFELTSKMKKLMLNEFEIKFVENLA